MKTICTNNDGSFNCDCDVGYTRGSADGTCDGGNCVGNCIDIDECLLRIDTCHDRTECANTDGRNDFKKLVDALTLCHGDSGYPYRTALQNLAKYFEIF